MLPNSRLELRAGDAAAGMFSSMANSTPSDFTMGAMSDGSEPFLLDKLLKAGSVGDTSTSESDGTVEGSEKEALRLRNLLSGILAAYVSSAHIVIKPAASIEIPM